MVHRAGLRGLGEGSECSCSQSAEVIVLSPPLPAREPWPRCLSGPSSYLGTGGEPGSECFLTGSVCSGGLLNTGFNYHPQRPWVIEVAVTPDPEALTLSWEFLGSWGGDSLGPKGPWIPGNLWVLGDVSESWGYWEVSGA